MPYVERTDEEIIQAWERLVSRHPSPDRYAISFGREYSVRQLVEAMKAGDADVLYVFVAGARPGAKEIGDDSLAFLYSHTPNVGKGGG